MPNLNGTGPMGRGPRTGRGMGYYGVGRRGCGCGNCYGGCHGSQGFISPKNQLLSLEEDERILEEQLAIIREEKIALQD